LAIGHQYFGLHVITVHDQSLKIAISETASFYVANCRNAQGCSSLLRKMTSTAVALLFLVSIFRTSTSSSAKMNPLMASDAIPTQCSSGSNFQCGPGTGFGCELKKSSETPLYYYTVSSKNTTICSANQVTHSWTGQPNVPKACTHRGEMTVTIESPCWQKAMFPYGGDYKSVPSPTVPPAFLSPCLGIFLFMASIQE
jgi:hypothetical protein